jgi:hypothetical protein
MSKVGFTEEEKELKEQRNQEIHKAKVKSKQERTENIAQKDINDISAPRNYCSTTIKFNKFEYDRLADSADREGVKIIDFIRSALKERAEDTK